MKKKVIIAVVAVLMLAVLGGAIYYFASSGNKIANGTYRVVGCEEYPNATITVKNGSVQFTDIDLNAYFQEKLQKIYESYKNSEENSCTEDELTDFLDLNKHFVQNVYDMNKNKCDYRKAGTFEYRYFWYTGELIGVGLVYNSNDKTINACCLGAGLEGILFEKE
ncbi:MAG: hypothetical protein K6F92_03855 [Lachnospiraceae bacterium]|nr:hypothetical protein [Lachnospiraceae bacterium]